MEILIDPLAAWILALARRIAARPEEARRAAEVIVGLAAVVLGHGWISLRVTQWLKAHREALTRVAEAVQGAGASGQAVKDALTRDPVRGAPRAALDSVVAMVRDDRAPAPTWKRLAIVLIPWAWRVIRAASKRAP